MRTIAAIEADFTRGALGTRSRLNDDLLGETVLRRTLKRVLAARRIDRIHLVVTCQEKALAEAAVAGLDVAVQTHDGGPTPWRDMVSSARKWSLDAWRGGLVGTSLLDECFHPWVLEALCRMDRAEAVVAIPPAAPLLDPALLDQLVEHYEQVRSDMRMTFTQTAPGLSAGVFQPALIAEMAQAGQPLYRVMAYRPDEPRKDLAQQSAFFSVAAEIAHAIGRCIADTQCAVDRITAILQDTGHAGDGAPDAMAVSRWLAEHQYGRVDRLPEEVEIELTTEDSLPDTTLRPRGKAIPRRGPMSESVFRRLVDELAARDDVRIILGGFGDPLVHPDWPRLVEYSRQAGIFAIAVRTPAVTLDTQAIAVLVGCRVDVLNVLLDAVTPETYRRVHNADHFERVTMAVENVGKALHQARQPQPLIVCEMAKTRATIGEMERFFDHWIGKTGSVYVAGPSHYARQWPELAVMSMAPPLRGTCHRLFHRIMVLADGRVTVCDQDFQGRHTVGSVADASLSDLWAGPAMTAVRESHLQKRFDGMPLCPACEEWNRP